MGCGFEHEQASVVVKKRNMWVELTALVACSQATPRVYLTAVELRDKIWEWPGNEAHRSLVL